MSLAKISNAIDRMERIYSIRENKNNENIILKNTNDFLTYVDHIIQIENSLKLLKNHFKFVVDSKYSESLKEQFIYANKIFQTNNINNIKSRLKIVSNLEDNISSEWSSFSNEFISEIKDKLSILKVVSDKPKEVQMIINGLSSICKWPINQTDISNFFIFLDNGNEFLKLKKFDNEIENFLIKLVNKKATILDLSQNIIDWIKKENLEEKIFLKVEFN